ncbi:MAG TPA: bifunctional 4-hydroxy-2-oxoglutarate aldolase/2-dehydro-3-deoxy-phosphogluconate aldolase [Microbacteriaceae bacterium]|nr:bifunctional 4-hydroxy-2-oxoglutarate aldolase/2-dehydro-3-deoxy-phosphogluconate aldolase [Microbacteriaceae bacterium]
MIAVLRARAPHDYDHVLDVLAEGGVRFAEVTLSTPGTLDYLPTLVARGDLTVGVGTITTVAEAERAIDGGAAYLVTPVTVVPIVELAVSRGVPVFPGGLTPTELYAGWQAGASAVKIFPAQTVGAAFGKHLRGPFPDLQFVPSGGVGLNDIPAWLAAGALAVSVGGPLIGDALRGGDLDALAARTHEVVAAAEGAR